MTNTEIKRVAVNGASGRIGRAVTYELMTLADTSLDLVVLNDPIGIDKVVESLAGTDPVHGKFDWSIQRIDDSTIAINGKQVKVYAERDITKIPLQANGVKIVEECSGFFGDDKKDKTRNLARPFLEMGVERVVHSYPADSADVTLIMGVNEHVYDPAKHRLISNGSCTTKALAAPLQVLLDYGVTIQALLMDTVHAATNSQNILQSLDQIATHKTGAAKATGLVIPSLKGKMDGLSFRVPTLDGSFANLYFVASYSGAPLTAELINSVLINASKGKIDYSGRIGIIEEKEASTKNDIVGRTENALVVTSKTRVIPVSDTQYLVSLVSGYDNERGPPKDQVMLTQYIARQ